MLNKEQMDNSEPFPVTNLPVYLINSEQIGISEQFYKFLIAKFDCIRFCPWEEFKGETNLKKYI